MKIIFTSFSLMVFLAALFMITDHQGAVQKLIRISFLLIIINVLFYIYNLRR